MKLSILISSCNRSNLLRRCLYWINKSRPNYKFEVIIADDNSDNDECQQILTQLNRYSFPWKFIDIDSKKWEKETGLKVYAGNPALTNNIAFNYSTGSLISLVGNECIVYDDYDKIIEEFESYNNKNAILFTTTYDINLPLDDDGQNLSQQLTPQTFQYPLQSPTLRTDVTNYCSLTTSDVWNQIGGYDEIYLRGIAAEDSDFVRRARLLPNFQTIHSNLTSFHQYHGGKTMYYEPEDLEYKLKFYKGLVINRGEFHSWDGKRQLPKIKFGDCIKQITVKNYGN